jgi:phosphoserine phosphatase RsbU/P
MDLSPRTLRFRLLATGLLPRTRLARAACYMLGLDLLLFSLQRLFCIFKSSWGSALSGWVGILSALAIILLSVLAYRRLKARLLWRLRNRLIVTYMFIGVIPVVLLAAMAFITLYLFAGQFANFVVTSELDSRLRSLQSVNAAIANELAARLEHAQPAVAESLEGLKRNDPAWASRQVCAWKGETPLAACTTAAPGKTPFALPSFLSPTFGAIVWDHEELFLRAGTEIGSGPQRLSVVSSEALDRELLETLAKDLGEITLYSSRIIAEAPAPAAASAPAISLDSKGKEDTTSRTGNKGTTLESGREELRLAFTVGALPAPGNTFDREIAFATPISVVDWATGAHKKTGALLRVLTRPSVLYTRLFATLGDFATGVEYALLFAAVVFAIIELFALFIGTRLTRTVTGAVAQLYNATEHINRGNFSHRISVKSHDQLATLANSFNSMTESIESLIEEQKEKQRLQNELTIAQEVQSQLYPQHISQLASLEVYGFCRPARTVSGDYYDFLTLNSDRIILAVGDVSGKGISAALLMATIHSAVRAYSLESMPSLRQPVVAAAGPAGSSILLAPPSNGSGMSSGTMLSLLNHQLYQSTPAEKYATLFLAVYDGRERKLTYSNGGHLPPIILGQDGSVRRLEQGGTVIGLFDDRCYEESSVALRRGELFLAYSDGVTEPENDFGEFGEQRLIDLVWEHRDQPLARISEIVTAAVDDWIGANEQPDDITLVLARGQ